MDHLELLARRYKRHMEMPEDTPDYHAFAYALATAISASATGWRLAYDGRTWRERAEDHVRDFQRCHGRG